MKLRLMLMVSLFISMAPLSASAIPITVTGAGANDGAWDITLVEDSFNNIETLLNNQVWWGDESLALIFADALGFVNGVTNGLGLGPYFATSNAPQVNTISFATWSDGTSFPPAGAASFVAGAVDIQEIENIFATAERGQVPTIGTLALTSLGLAAIGLFRRRV